jgi:hypothetical protein
MTISLPYIPVGWGEVFDKITILEIKSNLCDDPSKLKNIQYELQYLNTVLKDHEICVNKLGPLLYQLRTVNQVIWDTENVKRKCEILMNFGDLFIKASRESYVANDKRAQIKRKINEVFSSEIFEEKIYKP